jgi:hypothetical protein
LKYPSLLKFDEAYRDGVIRHNLKTLYGVERAPCDTQLRTILDAVDPHPLRSAFRAVHRHLQRGKAVEAYQYLDGHSGKYHRTSSTTPDRSLPPTYSSRLRRQTLLQRK